MNGNGPAHALAQNEDREPAPKPAVKKPERIDDIFRHPIFAAPMPSRRRCPESPLIDGDRR
jgi:hypothetical protein